MADKKQLARLKKSVRTWNNWREKNQNEKIDLANADLTNADLTVAKLDGATLDGATLTSATLTGATLTGATLTGATLTGAKLDGANLTGATLDGATLTGAILFVANLTRAKLRDADLTDAIVGYTSFDNVDLGRVKGLETVKHQTPSAIGIDTIYKSQGNIPEVFLRGCGVPDNFIEYMHSLTGKAFAYYSCFISYSNKDKEFAERVYADLQRKGVRCWFAPENLQIGDKFRTRIDEAIQVYDKLLIILSDNSINSDWVEAEVEAAMEKERNQKRIMLFPVRLDNGVMETDKAWAADIRRTRHIGDMSNWKDHDSYQKAFDRLLRDLKAEGVKS